MVGRASWGLRARATAFAAVVALTLGACGGAGDAASGGGGGGGGTEGGAGDQEQVTLRYSWWGDAARAELVEEAITAFEEANPGITVQGTFSDYEPYWQKLSTEVAGGGAPDVMQMDYSYLREYGDRDVLLDLNGQVGANLQTDDLVEGIGGTGVVDGSLLAVPVGTNCFSMAYRTDLFEQVGVDPSSGLTWDEYDDAIAAISEQTDVAGAPDYTGVFYDADRRGRARAAP